MKMTVSRMFEAGRVLEAFKQAKIEGIEGFVTFLSDFSENVIRGMRGQLTFKDNHSYEEREVDLSSGVPQSIRLSKTIPAHMVLIGKCSPYGTFVSGFSWAMQLDGTLGVVAEFSPPPEGGKAKFLLAVFY